MLIKLHEATVATTPEAIDAFSSITSSWYASRYDAAVHLGTSGLGGYYKLFRDGTLVRMCSGAGQYEHGFSIDHDLPFAFPDLGGPSILHDPISMKYDPAKPGPITYTGLVASGHSMPVVYGGYYYTISGVTVTKRNLATGASVATYTLTGALTFSGGFGGARLDICHDSTLVAWVDNGTYTVVRFFDLSSNTNLYESVIERSKSVVVDRVHKNIWSVKLSDNLMQVYSFDVAPYSFTPFTMGANKSRYRQDALSGTLLGAQGEPVRFWPVGWRLTQPSMGGGFLGDLELGFGALGSNGSPGPSAEGHLETDITETDENGVAENLYCGPGSVDYVGQSATVEVWTGY